MSPEKIKRWSEAITEAGKSCAGGWKARLLGLLLLVFISGGEAFAQGNPSSSQPNQNNNDSYPIRGAGDVRFYDYFPRYPAAACFGPQCEKNPKGKDIIENRESKKDGTVKHEKSGPVYMWPIIVPSCTSKVPTKRDEAINDNMLKTFGYPISDTQFQMIHRYDNQIMLEQMFDPERLNWTGAVVGATQMQDVANGAANTCRNQCASAIDFVGCSIYNFTIDESNKWNKVRNELFLPMAVLLLLPGAVLAQLRVIVAAGMPIQGGDVNPFEGITRSIVAIFLIPATYLVVNYGIDLNNSITYTIYSEYQRIFGTDMYKDALCAVVRAHPVRQGHEERNAMDQPAVKESKEDGKGGTPALRNEKIAYDVKKEDPNCNGPGEAPKERASEANSFLSTGQRALTNASNAGLGAAWNILCAFQVVFLMYLWFVGPVVAALWVYPSAQLRGALPSWTEGVITLCFWSLFWNTTVLLMACFKGIDETGTIIQSALLFLATASVKFAFDFAGLVKAAGAEAGGMAKGAAQQAGQGAGASPGAGAGRGGRPGQPPGVASSMGSTAGGIGSDQGGAAVTLPTGGSDLSASSMSSPGIGGSATSNEGSGSGGGTGATGSGLPGDVAAGAGAIPLTAGLDPNAAANQDGKGPLVDPASLATMPLTGGPLDPGKGIDPTNLNNLNSNINAMTGKEFTQQQLAAMAAGVQPGQQLPFNSEQLRAMGVTADGQGKLFDAAGNPLMGANNSQLNMSNVGTGAIPGVAGGAGSTSNAYNMMSGSGGPAGMIPPVGTSIARADALTAANNAIANGRALDSAQGFAPGTGPREAAANQLMSEVNAAGTGQNLTMTPGLYQAMQAQQGDSAMGSTLAAQQSFAGQYSAAVSQASGMITPNQNGQAPATAVGFAERLAGIQPQGSMTPAQLTQANMALSGIQGDMNKYNAELQSGARSPSTEAMRDVGAVQQQMAAANANFGSQTNSLVASMSAGPISPYSGSPTAYTGTSNASGFAPSAYATGGAYAAASAYNNYTQTPGTPTVAQGGAPGTPTGYAPAQPDAGVTRVDMPASGSGGTPVNTGYGTPINTGYAGSAPGPGGYTTGPGTSTPMPAPAQGEQIAYTSPGSQSGTAPYQAPANTSSDGGYGSAPSGYSGPVTGNSGPVSGGDYTSSSPAYNNTPPPPQYSNTSAPLPAPNPQYNNSAPSQGNVSSSYTPAPQYSPPPAGYSAPSYSGSQAADYNNQSAPATNNNNVPATSNNVFVTGNNQPTPTSGPANVTGGTDYNNNYTSSAPSHQGGQGPVILPGLPSSSGSRPSSYTAPTSSSPRASSGGGGGYYAASSGPAPRPPLRSPSQGPAQGQARAGGSPGSASGGGGGRRADTEDSVGLKRGFLAKRPKKKPADQGPGVDLPPWLKNSSGDSDTIV